MALDFTPRRHSPPVRRRDIHRAIIIAFTLAAIAELRIPAYTRSLNEHFHRIGLQHIHCLGQEFGQGHGAAVSQIDVH